jgi:hypothetical protein
VAVFVNGPLAFYTHTHADTTKIAGSTVIERTCNPSDRGYAKLHPTIHCPSTEISLGRGLELLLEDGCLRGGWPDPVFCTRCYESVSTDCSSCDFSASFTFVSRSAATANSAGVR